MFDPLSGDERAPAESAPGNTPEVFEELPSHHNGSYEYYDATGDLCFVIQRYEKDGKKSVYPFTPSKDERGNRCWLKSLQLDGPRPLYRLPALLECDQKRPIMVVEGEKCVEAVLKNSTKAFPVTWAGGTNAWQKTDWSPLYGRPLILVADGDEAGHKVMQTLAADLHQRCPKIGLVLPPIAAGGPDIADEIKAGRDVNAWLETHLQPYKPEEIGEGSPDPSPPQSSERDNDDEWSSLIAEAKDSPGLFLEPETLRRLADLESESPNRWEDLRDRISQDCKKVRIQKIDKAINRLNGGKKNDLQGRPLEWQDPEPWPEPVNGAALLNEVASLIRQYLYMPEPSVDAVTLWIVHTWLHDKLEISTFLNLTSATKRCGKSLLMEILATLVARPLAVSGQITSAALFRTIELHEPTLLLDEVDTYFRGDPQLLGIFNGSQRRDSAGVIRCVGEDHEPRNFNTWCVKALSGIRSLPDTVLDRSLVIQLERRPVNLGDLPRWRDRDQQNIKDMRRKLARWVGDNAPSILTRRKEVVYPPCLHDRARDAWESPLAIADCAGGAWAGKGKRAWLAVEAISTDTKDETGARETLLADIHRVFREAGDPKALSTGDILEKLNGMEDRPWPEWKRGNPLSPRGLASLLKPFGILPGTVRTEGIVPGVTTAKGYKRSAFVKVWKNYSIQETPSLSVTHTARGRRV